MRIRLKNSFAKSAAADLKCTIVIGDRLLKLSVANYDASGDVVGSREGGRWASIIPDTVGETLYSGACRAN